MARKIKLTQGRIAIVDDADFAFLNQWSWQVSKKGYAVRSVHLGKIAGRYKKTAAIMHRILTAAPHYLQVDHINGNKVDNRKANLRLCTNGQNKQNGAGYKNSTSKYRGVSWHSGMRQWYAQIQKDKRKYTIGWFENEVDAAKAYNRRASKLFGEFARLNEIQDVEPTSKGDTA
jgi:hypothetical protein